jgi:hypothetical protein
VCVCVCVCLWEGRGTDRVAQSGSHVRVLSWVRLTALAQPVAERVLTPARCQHNRTRSTPTPPHPTPPHPTPPHPTPPHPTPPHPTPPHPTPPHPTPPLPTPPHPTPPLPTPPHPTPPHPTPPHPTPPHPTPPHPQMHHSLTLAGSGTAAPTPRCRVCCWQQQSVPTARPLPRILEATAAWAI